MLVELLQDFPLPVCMQFSKERLLVAVLYHSHSLLCFIHFKSILISSRHLFLGSQRGCGWGSHPIFFCILSLSIWVSCVLYSIQCKLMQGRTSILWTGLHTLCMALSEYIIMNKHAIMITTLFLPPFLKVNPVSLYPTLFWCQYLHHAVQHRGRTTHETLKQIWWL